jgi:predicted RNA binding protein YcfA (HicA-like mRNA interferase family)
MPPKIRQLIKALEKAGFKNLGGKGSHKKFRHPSGSKITISGKLGEDARIYQILEVRKILESAKNEKK